MFARALVVWLLVAVTVAVASSLSAATGSGAEPRWKVRDLGTFGWYRSEAVGITDRSRVIVSAQTAPRSSQLPDGAGLVWDGGNVTALRTLRGDCSVSVPLAINKSGEVVGFNGDWYDCSIHDFSSTAVLWSGETPRKLTGNAEAVAINDRHQVVVDDDEGSRAWVWERGRLTALPGASWAEAINSLGQVVGHRGLGLYGPGSTAHAFVWHAGRMRDLGTLPKDRLSQATAINDHGVVAGNSFATYEASQSARGRAFVWADGRMGALASLGGRWGRAIAVGSQGQIVGWSMTASGRRHAVVWKSGRTVDLGTLPGDVESKATAVSNNGQIIGNGSPRKTLVRSGEDFLNEEEQPQRGFVWQNGKMVALPTLGGRWSHAEAINSQGQVVGWATTKTGGTHAVLWTKAND